MQKIRGYVRNESWFSFFTTTKMVLLEDRDEVESVGVIDLTGYRYCLNVRQESKAFMVYIAAAALSAPEVNSRFWHGLA